MKKRLILAATLASLAVATPAQAEESAKEILAQIDGQDEALSKLMSVILGAFGVGIEWASVAVERDGGKPLFCLPTKLALTPVQQADMLRRHVKEYPFTADSPAGLVLLKAYQDTFPCTPRT